ncbi:hypothetical protein AWB77_03844 [Caballeronia fortuita]|uniref:Uncharacterized protein n=1 Tax=Caballeronia fortuita TaxID=1777138 RepID=A0A158C9V1_9BURK|nr:hypothetical protein AWB77_03844 [Caballeronia fortuita]
MNLSQEVITRCEFRARLGISEEMLNSLLSKCSVFSLGCGNENSFPAVLSEPQHDRRRLFSLCRIIRPAPPSARLSFLTSGHGALRGKSPVEALISKRQFCLVREIASAWASEWSRTIVTVCIGAHSTAPVQAPAYVAIDEVDPRRCVWARAAGAMQYGGYVTPDAPYPYARRATAFITRKSAGCSKETVDAKLDIAILGRVCFASIHLRERSPARYRLVLSADRLDVVEVLGEIVGVMRRESLEKRRKHAREASGQVQGRHFDVKISFWMF